jgi:hypothetical protein
MVKLTKAQTKALVSRILKVNEEIAGILEEQNKNLKLAKIIESQKYEEEKQVLIEQREEIYFALSNLKEDIGAIFDDETKKALFHSEQNLQESINRHLELLNNAFQAHNNFLMLCFAESRPKANCENYNERGKLESNLGNYSFSNDA